MRRLTSARFGTFLSVTVSEREQACDHQRQSRVLGPADRDRAVQAMSARYANSVHLVRRDRVARHLPEERAKLSLSCRRRAPAPQGFELIRA